MISLYRYRNYIFKSAAVDLRHRYTGTGLGVFWNVISPLAQIAVYAIVFSQIMSPHLPGDDSAMRFVIYLCSGILPWLAFSECVTRGTNSFLESAPYLKKLPIPEPVFVARTAMAATFSLAISLFLLILFACFMQHPQPTWLLVPIVCILWQAMGFGLGMALGTLNVFIRDIGPIVTVVFQIWMWTVPIVYLPGVLPTWAQRIEMFNPPYPFVVAIHDLLIFGQLPALWVWPAMIGWCACTIIIGMSILHALRRDIRDVI